MGIYVLLACCERKMHTCNNGLPLVMCCTLDCNAAAGVIGMLYPILTFDHNAINSLKKTVAKRSSHTPDIALKAFACCDRWGVCLCVNLQAALLMKV